MAEIWGNLWEYNLTKLVVVDVTDDYALDQPPMPSDFYPVVAEMWVPVHSLPARLPEGKLVEGYLYDWHERPDSERGIWYVGVVREDLALQWIAEAEQRA